MRAAVDSVSSQNASGLEYIIVDGGSMDGTVDYIRSLNGKVSKFISEPDKGLYDALNKGIRLCTGDIVGLLHADDVYADENVLQEVAQVFDKSGADAVYGDLVYVAQTDTSKVIRYWRSGEYDPSRLAWGWMPPHPALFIRRELYEKARLPNGDYFDTSLKIAADYDFMMRLLGPMGVKPVYLPRVLVKMRVGGASNKSLGNIMQKSREDLVAMRRNSIGGIGTLIAKNLRKLPQFLG